MLLHQCSIHMAGHLGTVAGSLSRYLAPKEDYLCTFPARLGCGVHAGQPWVLRKAVNHIETFSILESLQRMVGAADHSNANVPTSDLQWLPSTTIMQHLTSK